MNKEEFKDFIGRYADLVQEFEDSEADKRERYVFQKTIIVGLIGFYTVTPTAEQLDEITDEVIDFIKQRVVKR